jgi:hypothetical protein
MQKRSTVPVVRILDCFGLPERHAEPCLERKDSLDLHKGRLSLRRTSLMNAGVSEITGVCLLAVAPRQDSITLAKERMLRDESRSSQDIEGSPPQM